MASGTVEVGPVRPPAAVAALVPLAVVLAVLAPTYRGGPLLAAILCGVGVLQTRRAGAALAGRSVSIGLGLVSLALVVAQLFR